MPIYEYMCTDCGKVFEVFQKITDEPLKECSLCHGDLTKLISNCSFQLKGTGWYATDYKRPLDTTIGKPAAHKGNGEGKEKGNDNAPMAEKASTSPSETNT